MLIGEVIEHYLAFGQAGFLLFFFIPFHLYIAWAIAALLIESVVLKNPRSSRTVIPFVKSTIRVNLVTVGVFAAIAVLVFLVDFNPQQRSDIMLNNNKLMAVDKWLFGVYVPFWFHQGSNPFKFYFDTTAALFIQAYSALTLVLGFVFLLLIVVNKQYFGQLCVAFIASIVLSAPLWYLFPALSPLEGYLHPRVPGSIPEEIRFALLDYQPSEYVKRWIEGILDRQGEYPDWFLPITTIPSMHVAWVLLAVYFAARAWKPTLLVGLPYFVLNLIGTVYTLQHYAIDLFAGIGIALVAIAISQRFSIHQTATLTTLFRHLDADVKRLKLRFKALA